VTKTEQWELVCVGEDSPSAFYGVVDANGDKVALLSSREDRADAERNGRMIAAAPELLAAVKKAWFEFMWYQVLSVETVALMEAAGAKAEGQPIGSEYTETEMNCRGCMGPCGRCHDEAIRQQLEAGQHRREHGLVEFTADGLPATGVLDKP
jgi:hypothetical protein